MYWSFVSWLAPIQPSDTAFSQHGPIQLALLAARGRVNLLPCFFQHGRRAPASWIMHSARLCSLMKDHSRCSRVQSICITCGI